MGIRYFALSIDVEQYERLAKGPCPACGELPRLDEPDYGHPDYRAPVELDLDKSWSWLQGLFGSADEHPSSLLVAGEVTNTPYGWISHRGLLSPEEVERASMDIDNFGDESVAVYFQSRPYRDHEREAGDIDYVAHHLTHAKTFLAEVASRNLAVVYFIG